MAGTTQGSAVQTADPVANKLLPADSSPPANSRPNPSKTTAGPAPSPSSSSMSDLQEAGFKSSNILIQLADALSKMSKDEKAALIKKTNGVFQLNIKNGEGKEGIWTIDMKKDGDVVKGPKGKPDSTLSLDDNTFAGLADGTINAQKAFMQGKLKVKGNVMLSTKLDAVLKNAKAKL